MYDVSQSSALLTLPIHFIDVNNFLFRLVHREYLDRVLHQNKITQTKNYNNIHVCVLRVCTLKRKMVFGWENAHENDD